MANYNSKEFIVINGNIYKIATLTSKVVYSNLLDAIRAEASCVANIDIE